MSRTFTTLFALVILFASLLNSRNGTAEFLSDTGALAEAFHGAHPLRFNASTQQTPRPMLRAPGLGFDGAQVEASLTREQFAAFRIHNNRFATTSHEK